MTLASDSLLRKARIQDVKTIHSLLVNCQDGLVLPRSFSELYSRLREFYVAADKGDGRVVGCCALSICWENLAEVRSLVVERDSRGKGLGRQLVEACLSEALTLGIYRIFTLTDRPQFFIKLGFKEVSKESLPQKVWADCLNCPKFPDCDEVALVMDL
ncbi:MAG: N-acetyltransferase [Desulfovibrionaceae bacterium]|nr:N-acetyltransferase [Desulfovibrionaceae bacterium]MDD4952702.1 N-acetyltransferase [Desulfovibrionaceae bacterium]